MCPVEYGDYIFVFDVLSASAVRLGGCDLTVPVVAVGTARVLRGTRRGVAAADYWS